MNAGTEEILAVIPARGGSKGIPRKNIADLGGKPLIAWSILVAKSTKSVDRVIVSTDDEEIAEVARAWGAEVPFMRPKEIAGDRAYLGDAFKHALTELKKREGYAPDLIMELYPTHPFRTPALLDELCEIARRGYSTVWTVRPIPFDELSYVKLNQDGNIAPLLTPKQAEAGTAGIAFRKYGLASLTALSPSSGEKYYFPVTDPASLVDIDEPVDLIQARCMIRSNLFNFGLS